MTHPATGPLFFPPPLQTHSNPNSLHLPQQVPSPPSLSKQRVFLARQLSHARVVRWIGARLLLVDPVWGGCCCWWPDEVGLGGDAVVGRSYGWCWCRGGDEVEAEEKDMRGKGVEGAEGGDEPCSRVWTEASLGPGEEVGSE